MQIKLRIWWIPNCPAEAFTQEVDNVSEAIEILLDLTDYDLGFISSDKVKKHVTTICQYVHYLTKRNITIFGGVESNVGGLEVFENGEWSEYYDSKDRDIWEVIEEEE